MNKKILKSQLVLYIDKTKKRNKLKQLFTKIINYREQLK